MESKLRENIIEYAKIFLNKPYVWGATGPNEFDCSGFTYFIYKELFQIDINSTGYGIGDTTKQMTNNIGILKSFKEDDPNKQKYLKDIKKGDLIFFHRQSLDEFHPTSTNKYPGHVGIYIEKNQFIHASSDEEKIVISTLDDYWLKKFVATRNILADIIKS